MKDHHNFNLNLQLFGSVSDGAESNLVTKSRMAKVREVDFVERFTHNMLKKLMDALDAAFGIADLSRRNSRQFGRNTKK